MVRKRALPRARPPGAHLARTFGPAGGEPVAAGIDIAVVVDGRIARLCTVLQLS